MILSLRRLALAAVAAPALMFAAGAADARPFTARDIVTFERVSDPQVSPDGRWATYQFRQTDYDANRGMSSLWIIDLNARGAAPRRLVDGGNTARWSSDGRFVYFMKGGQVWRIAPAGGEAAQVTSLPLDVGAFAVSPDGRSLAVSLAVMPDCETLACTSERLDKSDEKRTGVLYDKVFVRHWDVWTDGTRNHLFALPIAEDGRAGDPVFLMRGFDGDTPSRPFGDDSEFTFTPDGRAIVFAAREAGRTEPWSTNFDLFQVPADGSAAPRNLTDANEAWDTGAVFSPDGKTLAYRRMKRPGFEADRWQIVLRDVATGAERELASDWDRSADTIQWSSDGRTIYTSAQDVGQTRIFAIEVASGRVNPVTGPGHVGGFDVAQRSIVYAQDDLDSPAQIFRVGTRDRMAPVQLTNVNAGAVAEIDWGEYEQFSFPGWNGETVHGYVIKPTGYVEGRKYPVAFLIHGGPQGSFGNMFHYRWNPQSYAGLGYAVVMIDFHGSTGYGQAFTDSISGHWGDRPLEDLKKGWAAALDRYAFLDGEKACALGASYGGYMVNLIAGKWNGPWRCLVNHAGVFDVPQLMNAMDLGNFIWEFGGPSWERMDLYRAFSPGDFVGDWTKPMLVLHGSRDFRVPMEQGLATFSALQREGIPSRFVHVPDENHWVLKPRNWVDWQKEILDWTARWTAEAP